MTLSWNEIKDRALKFSKEWADTSNEEADAKPFLVEFFNVFWIVSFPEFRSNKISPPLLLRPNRIHRIQPACAQGGNKSGDNSNYYRYDNSNGNI